jgi:hypothetical protein
MNYILFFLSILSVNIGINAYNSTSSCYCTTVPCPIEGSNFLTIGGGTSGIYYYTIHNNIPVITSANIRVSIINMDKGSDTTTCSQNYARSLDDDGIQDCDAGHILANRLGGPGNQPINIFPQDLSVNRGPYAQYEDTIYTCVTTKGVNYADLTWLFTYSSNSKTKPISIKYDVRYTGGSCSSISKTFNN